MKLSMTISALCVACLTIFGCGDDVPSEREASASVWLAANEMAKLLQPATGNTPMLLLGNGIELLEKVNAETLEIQGQKHYVYHYRAASVMPAGWWWSKSFAKSFIPDSAANCPGCRPLPSDAVRIEEKSLFIAQGSITFKKTERGWVVTEPAKIKSYGYCEAGKFGGPKTCLALNWGRL